MLNVH